MKKYLLCLSLIATTAIACRPEESQESFSKGSTANIENKTDNTSEASENVAIYTSHSDFLNNFALVNNARNEISEKTTFNSIIVVPFDESIHGNFSEFIQDDGNLYIVASDSNNAQEGIGLGLTAKFKPGKSVDYSSKITDPSGIRTIKRNAILKSDIEAAFNSAKNVKRREFYGKSDITEINNPAALTRVDRLIASIEGVKGKVPENKLDEAFFELGVNFKETGILGPGGGYYSSLRGKNYTSIEDIKKLNFSDLDLLTKDRLSPKELFEVKNNWPWPSDHLPAVSVVDFAGAKVKVGTLNLLKKGFDDNRLQTSQGLGPQLASRYLEPVTSTRADTRPAIKPSDVKGSSSVPQARPERGGWKFSEIQAKDGWDINQIRQKAQATFIEKRLQSKDVNLLGLNEVSSVQATSIIEIAKRNNFLAIVTPSKRNARDTVTGRVETDLLDSA
ncbi:MAG: hypothetical protein AB8G05_03675 [Oligoflexales bacterium]